MGKAFLDDIADPSEEPAAVFRKRLTADAFGNSPACRTSTASRSPCSSWRTAASNGFHTWVIEHVGLTGVGDLVFNEGADHLIDAQGRKIGISIPLMSAFRISRRTDQRMARLPQPGGRTSARPDPRPAGLRGVVRPKVIAMVLAPPQRLARTRQIRLMGEFPIGEF